MSSKKNLKPGQMFLRSNANKKHVRSPDAIGLVRIPEGYDPAKDGPFLRLAVWGSTADNGNGFLSGTAVTEEEFSAAIGKDVRSKPGNNAITNIIP